MEPAGGKRPAVVPVAETDAARLMRLLDYALPGELIAQHPAARREDARLLGVDRASGGLPPSRFARGGGVVGRGGGPRASSSGTGRPAPSPTRDSPRSAGGCARATRSW